MKVLFPNETSIAEGVRDGSLWIQDSLNELDIGWEEILGCASGALGYGEAGAKTLGVLAPGYGGIWGGALGAVAGCGVGAIGAVAGCGVGAIGEPGPTL